LPVRREQNVAVEKERFVRVATVSRSFVIMPYRFFSSFVPAIRNAYMRNVYANAVFAN
jgi:hypothetical protein